MTENLFDLSEDLPREDEFFEELLSGDDVWVERIVSHGHRSEEGEWYDQETDEWVVLLQGESTLMWADGSETELEAGDAVFIAAHQKHRVASTTADPPCVWLAVHGNLSMSKDDSS